MKKKNFKSLKVRRTVVSNLKTDIIKGGASGYKYSCPRCYTDDEVICEQRTRS
ncbi:MAG: hypothetical protein AAF611_15920 [Bacteroidota bacterium]